MRTSLLLLFLGLSYFGFGQKFLQMEKYGSLKVTKYYIGDDLTYRITGDKTWYTGTIQDLLVEDGIILFANRFVKIGDIRTIKSFKDRRWSKRVGQQAYGFAGGWLLFSLGGSLVGWDLRWDTVIIAGSAVAIGFIIQKVFKSKKYKIGKKRRLRMLNLTPVKPVFGP